MDTDAQRREVLSELDNEWHTLKHGNPVPGLYPQDGTEQVKVRGDSRIDGDKTVTQYEIIVSDRGEVVGRYRVLAEERIADYRGGYTEEDTADETADDGDSHDGPRG